MGKQPPNGFDSEDLFQAAAFQWTWNEFPAFRRTFFHVPNEGKKNIIIAKKDEAKGLLSGVYDIVFMVPGFVTELKQPGNDLSENQKKFKVAMDKFGVPTYTCWYMDAFQEIVRKEFAKVNI